MRLQSDPSCAPQAALTELKLEFGAERDELRRRAATAEHWRAADAASAQKAHEEAQLLRAQFQARAGLGAMVALCCNRGSPQNLNPTQIWCRHCVLLCMSDSNTLGSVRAFKCMASLTSERIVILAARQTSACFGSLILCTVSTVSTSLLDTV